MLWLILHIMPTLAKLAGIAEFFFAQSSSSSMKLFLDSALWHEPGPCGILSALTNCNPVLQKLMMYFRRDVELVQAAVSASSNTPS